MLLSRGNCTKGRAVVDVKTKRLVRRLRPGQVAVVSHADMDLLAARSLVAGRVRVVLNAEPSVTGRFPCSGSRVLLQSGVPVVDCLGHDLFSQIQEGQEVWIEDGLVLTSHGPVARGRRLTLSLLDEIEERASANLRGQLERFVDNTMAFVEKEKRLFLREFDVPPLRTDFAGRPTVVVIRGQDYESDLEAIMGYIRHRHPVLVGVDGGADALLDRGLRPDLIIGDMDSASDRALTSGAELVVHAYADGRVPGASRVEAMGLEAQVLPLPGTSEDAALLLADQLGSTLIVAVGTHTSVIDYLEKGREGMASTLLTRLSVGQKLVDAKGVGHLYRYGPGPVHWLALAAAGLIPAVLVIASSPLFTGWVRLLVLRARLLWGW